MPHARYIGLLAATSARPDDAEHHFERALDLNGRIGARPWLAHTQRDYARMLSTRDRPGDTEQHSPVSHRRVTAA